MEDWPQRLLRWILPAACVHCREDLPPGAAGPLCPGCVKTLPAPPPEEAAAPGAPSCRAAVRHAGPAASLVHALKFSGQPRGARQAAEAMLPILRREPELAAAEALVPVPCHPARRRARGYDQALLIARALGERSGKPVLRALERRRAAPPAWSLGAARRREALRGAFGPAPWAGGLARGLRLVLVDDVCATGETLRDGARALREAGAASVAGLVFARAGRGRAEAPT